MLCPLRKLSYHPIKNYIECIFERCYEEKCQLWIKVDEKRANCAITYIGLFGITEILRGKGGKIK